MKKGAVSLLKQIGTVVAAMVLKAKPRVTLLGLLPNKKLLMRTISGRFSGRIPGKVEYVDESEEDEYLNHCLFDLEDDADDGNGGEEGRSDDDHDACLAINLVRSSREDGGAEFILEDEIDNVADVFIRRVRSQMMLQD
ncbi:uncharacterized protein LOC121987655 [Zingiber officinale]|uniref:uncharacterized protein LOC121987655 n=1 Tax=Zingiber officinale TaxID=94328 RepID=UPI001C4BD7D8|nr:uncharacterized protein LOC121987655 [Zingiber officinale]